MSSRFLTIDASAVRGHFQRLKELGVPGERLEKALGMREEELGARDARVPFLNNIRMIEQGTALIGPDTALRLGRTVSLDMMGVCGHIFRNCRNLVEVINLFIRYQRLLYAVSSFKVDQTAHRVVLTHVVNNPMFRMYNRLMVELAFSGVASTIRNLLEEEVDPLQVHFSYERPAYYPEYSRTFRGPLFFGQPEDRIVFSADDLEKPIPGNQEYVRDILIQHANGLLEGLKADPGLKTAVRKLLMQHLPSGKADVEMISRELSMSRWTLTRKLKDEGVTFQGLLLELKRELSFEYLGSERLSVGEIAFLLGYSEISTFRKAFKNWSGKSPSGYRREILSGGGRRPAGAE